MDEANIRRIIEFWFSDGPLDQPTLDGRMERWFSADPEFDAEIKAQFGELIDQASKGQLMAWASKAEGRLALILLIDQFRRNVYRGTRRAYSRDPIALKLCVEGARDGIYKSLSPIQQAFFFMPLQHAESPKIQQRSVRIYEGLAAAASGTLKATFETFAEFAELHHDIIESFGRFPHRNDTLGRESTSAETEYLREGALSFGQ